MSVKARKYYLLAGIIAAYWIGPLLFCIWRIVFPQLAYGYTEPTYEFGASRWLTIISVIQTWLSLPTDKNKSYTVRDTLKCLITWFLISAVFAELFFAFIISMDFRVWVNADNGPLFISQCQQNLSTNLLMPVDCLTNLFQFALVLDSSCKIHPYIIPFNSQFEILESGIQDTVIKDGMLIAAFVGCLMFGKITSRISKLKPLISSNQCYSQVIVSSLVSTWLSYYFVQQGAGLGDLQKYYLRYILVFVTGIPIILSVSLMAAWLLNKDVTNRNKITSP